MTRCRTTVLLAALVAGLAGTPAGADAASDAAVASFLLQTDKGVQEVDLVAARGESDVLHVRVQECGRQGCAGDETVLPLAPGQLELGPDAAALEVVLDGRALRITWALAGDGFRLSGAQLRSDGLGGRTTADTFAGRTAEAQVELDGERCTTTGALGTALRLTTQDRAEPVELATGGLRCER